MPGRRRPRCLPRRRRSRCSKSTPRRGELVVVLCIGFGGLVPRRTADSLAYLAVLCSASRCSGVPICCRAQSLVVQRSCFLRLRVGRLLENLVCSFQQSRPLVGVWSLSLFTCTNQRFNAPQNMRKYSVPQERSTRSLYVQAETFSSGATVFTPITSPRQSHSCLPLVPHNK